MPDYGDPISKREKQILQMVATGVTNRRIAHKLDISVNTVKVHLRNVFVKLGAESRTEATMIAVREGWISPGDASGLPSPSDIGSIRLRTPLGWGKRLALVCAGVLAIAGVTASFPRADLQTESRTDLPLDQSPDVSALVLTSDESSWSERAQMPTRRAHLALAAAGGLIVAIGGQTPEGITASVELFDPDSDMWRTGSAKPTTVAYISAAAIGAEVYVPGGCDDSRTPTTIAEAYHIETDSWRQITSLPEPRCAYAIAQLKGRLYLLGGWNGEAYVSTVFVYDPEADVWTEGTPLDSRVGFASAAALAGRLYLVGGYDGERELTSCRALDPRTDLWTSCAPLAMGRGALGLVTLANQMYAIGGGGWTSYLGFNERYEPNSDTWHPIETPLVGEWRSPGVVSVDNTVYAIGGWSNGHLSLNQVYEALPFRVFVPISNQ